MFTEVLVFEAVVVGAEERMVVEVFLTTADGPPLVLLKNAILA